MSFQHLLAGVGQYNYGMTQEEREMKDERDMELFTSYLFGDINNSKNKKEDADKDYDNEFDDEMRETLKLLGIKSD